MKPSTKLLIAILFFAGLCIAIWRTEAEGWLTAWFILLVYVALPLILVTARDALSGRMPRWLGTGQFLLHVCALFAAVLGYLVGWMAVDSEHPKANLHQLLVVVFPLFVYLTPLLMLLHGWSWTQIRFFYVGVPDDDDQTQY